MVKTVKLTILDHRSAVPEVPLRNPFQPAPGASPPILVGREAEVTAILEAVSRASSRSAPTPLAFLGLRGIGKTALLNSLAHSSEDGGIHLPVEAQMDVALNTTVANAMRQLEKSLRPLSKRLGKAVEDALSNIPMPSFELPHDMGEVLLTPPRAREEMQLEGPLIEAISDLNQVARKARKYLVITLDEIHNADVTSLRSVVTAVHRSASSDAPILFACAGLPQTQMLLNQMPTYVKRWDVSELTFLTRAETAAGFLQPARQLGVTIADSVVDLVVREAAGYPFFLQKYASAAWRHLDGNHLPMTSGLEETIQSTRISLERTYYAADLLPLPMRERAFVVGLAELGPGAHQLAEIARQLDVTSAAALGSTRSRLIKKGILFVPYSGAVQFRIPLTDRFVLAHKRKLLPPSVGDTAGEP